VSPAKRVLIVDDNVDAAESLATILRGMGHEAHVAHEGRSGLALAQTVRPDLVLLDIAMPGMSGYEVARQLRQNLGSSVRLVAVTGFGQDQDRAQSLSAGIDQHLVKPLDPAFLKSLLG
jgi:CheY-like chemotaxis protein